MTEMRIEIDVLTKDAQSRGGKEITLRDLARTLGLTEDEAFEMLEPLDKNLTVGDVHATTSLKDISVAYEQGKEDGEQEEEDESEAEREREDQAARKVDYEDGGNVSAEHLKAVDMLQGRLSRGQTKDYAVRAVCAQCGMTPAQLRRAYNAVHGRIRRPGDGQKLDKAFEIGITISKIDPDQRKVFGWASVCALDGKLVIDKQDDIIHIEDLEPAAHDFTLYSRTQGDMHTDIGVGRLIESIIFDQAKRDAGVVAKDDQGRVIDGWWVGFRVDDDDVWAAHKSGARLEFSIGGRAKREPQA